MPSLLYCIKAKPAVHYQSGDLIFPLNFSCFLSLLSNSFASVAYFSNCNLLLQNLLSCLTQSLLRSSTLVVLGITVMFDVEILTSNKVQFFQNTW